MVENTRNRALDLSLHCVQWMNPQIETWTIPNAGNETVDIKFSSTFGFASWRQRIRRWRIKVKDIKFDFQLLLKLLDSLKIFRSIFNSSASHEASNWERMFQSPSRAIIKFWWIRKSNWNGFCCCFLLKTLIDFRWIFGIGRSLGWNE